MPVWYSRRINDGFVGRFWTEYWILFCHDNYCYRCHHDAAGGSATVIIQSSGRYIFWRESSGLSWDLPFTGGIYEKANLENKVFSIIGHQTGMTFALIGRACFILSVLRKIIADFIKDIIL